MPGRPLQFSPEEVAEVIRLYVDEEWSTRAVGERMHCSGCAIARLLRREGVRVRAQSERGGNRPIPQATVQRVVAAYAEGKSLGQIALAEHISKTTVKRHLLASGVTLRPKGGSSPNSYEDDDCEVIEWLYWGMGYSLSGVATYMGLSPTVVLKRMQRHGIPRREQHSAQKRAFSAMKQRRWDEMWAEAHQAGRLRRPNANPRDTT